MEEQIMEQVVEQGAKAGLFNKENGIKALAVVGAAALVYGGYKGAKAAYRKFKKDDKKDDCKKEEAKKEEAKKEEPAKEEAKEEKK